LNPEVRRVPLAVLIDDGTASGAEIVAAALQDHGRARIFGRRTMGRGSIQTIRPLGSGLGAMKFTTAYWTSPSGRQIDGKGVDPDVSLDTVADGNAVVQVAAAALLSR
jgi:carboxyl-terminal processing protease